MYIPNCVLCITMIIVSVHQHFTDTTESECPPQNDAIWNISWTLATRGDIVQQKCPGGAESLGTKCYCSIFKHSQINFTVLYLGFATRLCDGYPAEWQPPNVDECSTVEITRIREEVENLNTIFEATQYPNNSDRTVMVTSEDIQSITGELASVTDKDNTSFLPNDLGNTLESIGTILRLFEID